MSGTQHQDPKPVPRDDESIVKEVRERYGQIAAGASSGCCEPSTSCCGSAESPAESLGYRKEALTALPDGSDLGLGCGAPLEALNLQPGETVLDLGSGAGIDVFIAARLVGPQGRVIGVDMTPEMIARAEAAAAKTGVDNVEFRAGRLESLPIENATIDAVTSNCVINLVPDKREAFREIARVLRPGGRLAISDILLHGELPAAVTDDLLAYVGCVAGAMDRTEYFRTLEEAGLTEINVVKEFDFMSSAVAAAPDEALALLGRSGVTVEELRGKVFSVTYTARKAAE